MQKYLPPPKKTSQKRFRKVQAENVTLTIFIFSNPVSEKSA